MATTRLLLLLCALPLLSRGEFTVYRNLSPQSTADYLVSAAAAGQTVAGLFADGSATSTINAGAVVNSTSGAVVSIVQQRRVAGFAGDVGTLAASPGLDFYELVTYKLRTQVYVSRHFGFESDGALVDKSAFGCLKLGGDEAECDKTLRCVGVIEGYCLLSSVRRDTYLQLPGIRRMRLKTTTHALYEWATQNVALTVFLLMVTQSGLLFLSRWSARRQPSR